MTREELKQYIDKAREGDYVLVDVRQPDEYTRGHIPGAELISIRELVADLSVLPTDKDLIFYCHSGGRSGAAAAMVTEEGWSNKNVYDLEGGIMAWEGAQVTDYPRTQVFDKSKSLSELLMVSMDLEKGAFRFYTYVSDEFASQPFSETFKHLSTAEAAHARAVYGHWSRTEESPPAFEAFFESLKGEILEGGEGLSSAVQRVADMEGDVCLHLIELALHIENSAFDLYRTMAERTDSTEARNVFLDIAQAEKGHMKYLIEAMGQCE